MYVWNPENYTQPEPIGTGRVRPPRPAPPGRVWCTPARSGRGAEHAEHAADLRATRLAEEARLARPRRPMVGPALAARLGVSPTTPA